MSHEELPGAGPVVNVCKEVAWTAPPAVVYNREEPPFMH